MRVKELQLTDKTMEDQHFSEWLASPTNKMLLSMVPEMSPPELLTTLLRSAYEYGVHSGAGQAAAAIAKHMLANRNDRDEE